MLIELHGAGFQNKGAQLMLETAARELRRRFKGCELCIATGSDRPYQDVNRLGLRFIWPSHITAGRRRKFPLLFRVENFLASRTAALASAYGMTTRAHADALIDISGYAFGDAWGTRPITNFALLSNAYATQGRPVLLLPQMFGPFDETSTLRAFQSLVAKCRLICPRDRKSATALREVQVPMSTEVRVAPDITIFNAVQPAESECDQQRVVIVPNARVFDKGLTDWSRETYVQFLVNAAKRIRKSDFKITILVHESSGKDADIARQISDALELNYSEIFCAPDPNELKSYISRSAFLLGSRFHSLVAALSTRVPVVAIGWAHKYGQLLKDFGVGEFEVKPRDAERLHGLLNQLVHPDQRRAIKDRLESAYQTLERENAAMWNAVDEILSRSVQGEAGRLTGNGSGRCVE